MTTPNRGVNKFTAQNLVAVLRAGPESNGTDADVARVAGDYDGGVRSHNVANWVQAGNADIRNGNNATACARFSKIYTDQLKEYGEGEATGIANWTALSRSSLAPASAATKRCSSKTAPSPNGAAPAKNSTRLPTAVGAGWLQLRTESLDNHINR